MCLDSKPSGAVSSVSFSSVGPVAVVRTTEWMGALVAVVVEFVSESVVSVADLLGHQDLGTADSSPPAATAALEILRGGPKREAPVEHLVSF
jgi:hypothetical protein